MMHRFCTAILLLLIAAAASLAAPADLIEHMGRQTALGPRSDGTEGERLAFDLIAARLDDLNIPYTRESLADGERGHSYSTNLTARIPGTNPEISVLAAPVAGGAFTTSVLLEIADALTFNPPNHTVVLEFLGGEVGDGPYHPYGSRFAADRLSIEAPIFALYLSGDAVPERWQIRVGGEGQVVSHRLIQTLLDAFSEELVPYRIKGMDIHAARLGLQGDMGPQETWLNAQIPTIVLEGVGRATNEVQHIKSFIRVLMALDYSMEGMAGEGEGVYVFVQPALGMQPRFISERPYIMGFLILSMIMLTVILIQIRNVRLNFRRFLHQWWTWPLLVSMVFFFLFLSTLFVEESIMLAGFSELWMANPGVFIFFKFTIAAALSLSFILLARGVSLPRIPHFYSYSAVLTAVLSMLVFMALDIAMAAYSLWTVAFLLAFTLSRNLKAKLASLVLSAFPYILGIISIAAEPYTEVLRFVLLSRISGNAFLTLLFLPVILALTSLNYWRLHYHRIRRSILIPTASIAMGLSAVIILFWIMGVQPFDETNPQPVELIDDVDLKNGVRKLYLRSPAPIGDVSFVLDEKSYSLENIGREAEVRTPLTRSPLEVRSTSRSFFGRRTTTLTMEGDAAPHRVELYLKSAEPFTLHEADMPFEMSPSGEEAQIFIGDNPPIPLLMRFAVNDDADLSLSIIATWRSPARSPVVNRSNLRGSAVQVVRTEIEL